MKYERPEKMVTIRANLTEAANLARYSETATIVTSNHKVAFVIVSPEWYEQAKKALGDK